ncbi:MAG: hypothetical protein ACRCUT_14015 [Spirochaetota bacterium]
MKYANQTNGTFGVTVDIQGLDAVLKSLEPKLASTATMRALNKVGMQGITAAKKNITSVYTIKYGQLKVDKINATIRNQQFVIKVSGRRRDMSKSKYFKARQTPSGVVAEIQKGKVEYYPGAFIAKHSTGGTNVYFRSRTEVRRVLKQSALGKYYYSQLPIKASLGPSPASLFNIKSSREAIQQVAQAEFPRVFRSQLSYELSRVVRNGIKRGIGA